MSSQPTLYINGEWLSAPNLLPTLNPSTGEVIAEVSCAGGEQVHSAVQSAREAFPEWARFPIAKRASFLSRAVAIIRDRYGAEKVNTPLKGLITKEMGKPLPEADIEVLETADMLEFFAVNGPALLEPSIIGLNAALWPTKRSCVRIEPLGVVGIIKPWNYPFELPIWSIAAALITGNTLVFKPSELTPLVGVEIGRIFEEAGLPRGVLNIVTGDADTGRALVAEDNIDMISFTGSVAVGREVYAKCATRLRKVSLELGGKDAAIVCADADLELATNGILWGAFANCGQVCTGIERVFVDHLVADAFLEVLVAKAKQLRLGVDIGPLASAQQLKKVAAHVDEAVAKGANALSGARRPSGAAGLENGYFYLPTVLTNVTEDMAVMAEETFGPVAPVIIVQSEKQALARANNTRYGLGASIWTADDDRARRLATELKVGMVWINDVNVAFPECPWGGIKESGIGVELSRWSVLEYAHLKHVNTDDSKDNRRFWWFPY